MHFPRVIFVKHDTPFLCKDRTANMWEKGSISSGVLEQSTFLFKFCIEQ
jgi:hypothetical protein